MGILSVVDDAGVQLGKYGETRPECDDSTSRCDVGGLNHPPFPGGLHGVVLLGLGDALWDALTAEDGHEELPTRRHCPANLHRCQSALRRRSHGQTHRPLPPRPPREVE